MSFAGRAFLRTRQLFHVFPSIWRINRFRWSESFRHQRLEVGRGTRFFVPVRSAGCGTLLIGANNSFGYGPAPRLGNGEILLQPRGKSAHVVIGNSNAFSNNVSVVAMGRIVFGNGCLVGDQVAIYDCDFHEVDPSNRFRNAGPTLPVTIGDNVWLGSRVMVLKGVSIEDNCVIAAMSVVTKSVPRNSLAAGNPARIIRAI